MHSGGLALWGDGLELWGSVDLGGLAVSKGLFSFFQDSLSISNQSEDIFGFVIIDSLLADLSEGLKIVKAIAADGW